MRSIFTSIHNTHAYIHLFTAIAHFLWKKALIISWAKVDRATRKDPLFQRIVRRQDDMNPPYIFLLFGVEAKLLFTSHSWPQWGGADLIGFLDEVARPVPVDTWSYHATFISTISCRSLPPLYLCIDVCSFFYIFDKFK